MTPRPPRRSARDEEFDRFEEKAWLLIMGLNLLTVINCLFIVVLN